MSEQEPEQIEDLDPAADPEPEYGDHPDNLTPEEAEAGQRVYEAIDDLDDESNGLDA